ncbi:iron-sulfur cluster assembly 2 homolog, mitochondrial [Daktulosphaira vitifoliae]|uniref:iron-sulfur cluster assembly 2 homolog, mitochondrial n=1 Tax=Daktulosphaira vitifoliae TaxID=58002 RepID=UPI0021A9ED9C|nr:iron-sulfur cluster assembly 2 homolog, mitochondrial [Daktulosphaira vitifoliae]
MTLIQLMTNMKKYIIPKVFYMQLQPFSHNDNDLKLTNECVQRLKEVCNEGEFLRLSVEGGGCSGFQYKFQLDTSISKNDLVFEKQGVKVVIDIISLDFVKGSTVDYEQKLIRSAFKLVGNPKAKDGCSCGASFSVKVD